MDNELKRRRIMRSILEVLGGVFVASAVLGCNVQGPGVKGVITLAPEVDPSAFTTLYLRTFPAGDEESFDPAVDPMPEVKEELQDSLSLDTVTFPTTYELFDEKGGPVDEKWWRVVAWISARTDSSRAPRSGDAWGTARYALSGCGIHGGYCTRTFDVDFTIDTLVP
jgi:hypothetical protein